MTMETELSQNTELQNTAFTTMAVTSTPGLNPANNNMTPEEIEEYLNRLQEEEVIQYIPALIFLLLLSVTGLVGNVLVLLVYRFKYPKSPTRICIMSISLFDLITNVVCIPGHVYEIFHKWDFTQHHLCAFIRYVNGATTITSGCILVAVAYCRYKKVCRPFGKQVSIMQAKIATVFVAVFSWTVSIPFYILNGSHSRPTPIPGIMGYDCYITNEYQKTIWPKLQYGFAVLLFFSLVIPMVVFYILIGIQAYKHRKLHGVGPVQLKGKSTPKQITKTNVSHVTEHKPWSRFFAFFNRKNNSQDHQAGVAFEKGEMLMTDENRLIEKSEDCCVVHNLAPDSIKLESVDLDGERLTSGYVTCDNDDDTDLETTVEVDKNRDGEKAGVKYEGHGTCREFERTHHQNKLSTYIEVHEDSSAQCTPVRTSSLSNDVSRQNQKTDTRRQTRIDDDQNEKGINGCEDSSTEGQTSLTQISNDETDRPQISVLEMKDNASKTPKEPAETANERLQVPAIEGKDLSTDTSVEIKKTQAVSHAPSAKNVEKNFFNKITGILLLVTVIFIVCFIPHFATVFFRYFQPENFKALGTSSLFAYHLFYRSFLLNSAANPIVYSIRDANFRQNVLRLFKSCK